MNITPQDDRYEAIEAAFLAKAGVLTGKISMVREYKIANLFRARVHDSNNGWSYHFLGNYQLTQSELDATINHSEVK